MFALARGVGPRVRLLDEPTAGMGPGERWQMSGTVRRLWEQGGMTLVFIEHDMDIVFEVAQKISVLRYGSVLAQGTAEQIRNNPEVRSEEHTSELQSLMRISYAVFCLKKNKNTNSQMNQTIYQHTGKH